MSKKRKKEKRDRGTYPGPSFADEVTGLLVGLFLAAMAVGVVALAWQRFGDDLTGVLDPVLNGIQGILDWIPEAGR